jgi:DNA-binding XRE family transcriptional regulator
MYRSTSCTVASLGTVFVPPLSAAAPLLCASMPAPAPPTHDAHCAHLVRAARERAGVTRAELARRADVPEQVVALWEDPVWEGHSLAVLRRVARHLGCRLELRLEPERRRQVAGRRRLRRRRTAA